MDVQHVNDVHEGYDAVVEHYRRLFGGVVVFDRLQPTWHACLLDVGGVLFEIFVPDEFFLHTRYGSHYLGIEFQVDDIDAVRDTLAARHVRIARDLDVAVPRTQPTATASRSSSSPVTSTTIPTSSTSRCRPRATGATSIRSD